LPDAPVPAVLLITFTRNLADTLGRQLDRLTDDPAVRARIEVLNAPVRPGPPAAGWRPAPGCGTGQ
jgi:hypothetical protein